VAAAQMATPTDASPMPASPRVTLEDFGPVAAMGLMFLAAQLLAVWVAGPFQAAGIRAFEDTGDPLNVVLYLVLIVAFTAFILYAAKRGWNWVIQGVILFAIGAMMFYVFYYGPVVSLWRGGWGGLIFAIGLASALTLLLYKWPEWYVVDSVGVVVAAGAVALIGLSFDFFLAILLLVGLAVYDFIAVYRTKHMISLADKVVGLRLPIMLVVPKHREYSFLDEKESLTAQVETGRPRDAMFMGLGDIVVPSVLVIIAYRSLNNPLAAVGALVGTFVGFLVLMSFVLKGRPHAGLPTLNGGSIAGFFIAYAFSGAAWADLGIPGIG
jgi:presenilin-like A22 family membrane protease